MEVFAHHDVIDGPGVGHPVAGGIHGEAIGHAGAPHGETGNFEFDVAGHAPGLGRGDQSGVHGMIKAPERGRGVDELKAEQVLELGEYAAVR